MAERLFRCALVSGLLVLDIQGCSHCERQACAPPPPPVFEPSPPPANLPPHPLQPYGAVPSGVWPGPAGINVPPPPAAQVPPPAAPVAPIPPPEPADVRGYSPRPERCPDRLWHAPGAGESRPPAPEGLTPRDPTRLYPPVTTEEANPRAAAPEILTPQPGRDPARLYPPATTQEPPLAPATAPAPGASTTPAPPNPAKPAVAEESTATPSMPVGISQFAVAQEGVTSGLKPAVYGGLDWLQANGYRAVLHIRSPGEDDTADRQVVDNHKLKYLSLEVSPKTLTPTVVDAFNRMVADAENRPLFVYDNNGVLAGGLWYLHFRTADQASDEVARLKAARLGLKSELDAENRPMWLAIERYLKEQK